MAKDDGEIVTDRDAHMKALKETGFWGRAAAGCLIQALDSGRILIPHRSEHCQQPNTWGTWGGAIDGSESPEQAVLRELAEEAGFAKPVKTIPLFVFRHDSGFQYHNFLMLVIFIWRDSVEGAGEVPSADTHSTLITTLRLFCLECSKVR